MPRTITYDDITHDYYIECNGEFLGYARTYHEAEQRCNEYAYRTLTQSKERT